MDAAPEWTLDQIAGLAFGVRSNLLTCVLLSLLWNKASVHLLRCMRNKCALLRQFILVASVLLAYKVDEAIARAQRRDLGICQECGGLFDARSCEEKRCPLRDEGVERE
jgi:hypothetical protein